MTKYVEGICKKEIDMQIFIDGKGTIWISLLVTEL